MLVSEYINDLRIRLFDPAPGAGWTDDELVGYLNEAIRATCNVKNDAYTLQQAITLVGGVTQELPTGGLALFDISENTVSGRRVTNVDRALLDEENRFWPTATQEVDVQHFTADDRAPRRFYVTPPNSGTGSVKALYGALPDPVSTASGSDVIPLQDNYQPALLSFGVARALSKLSKRRDPAGAAAAFNEWATMVGAKTATDKQNAPRVAEMRGVV